MLKQPARPFRASFLLRLNAIGAILCLCTAQTIRTTPVACFPPLFCLSSDAPIARFLGKFPDFVESTKTIIEHFQYVEKSVLDQLQSGKPPGSDSALKACNYKFEDAEKIRQSMLNGISLGHLPLPDTSCITLHTGASVSRQTEGPFSSRQLFEAMQTRGRIINDNLDDLIATVLDGITNPDSSHTFEYSSSSQTCVWNADGAVRRRDRWYPGVALTNLPNHMEVPESARMYVFELLSVGDDDQVIPLTYGFCEVDESGKPVQFHDECTTINFAGRRSGNQGLFERYDEEDNFALRDALQKSSYSIHRATDTLVRSNLAILFLPIGLTVVPIALFTDVSTVFLLLYALLTDVLTALPLMIKGIELIQISKERHTSVVTRVSSALNGTASEISRGEIWTASCRSTERVNTIGVAFVIIAVVLMIVGLLAEVGAQAYKKHVDVVYTKMLKERQSNKWSRGVNFVRQGFRIQAMKS